MLIFKYLSEKGVESNCFPFFFVCSGLNNLAGSSHISALTLLLAASLHVW